MFWIIAVEGSWTYGLDPTTQATGEKWGISVIEASEMLDCSLGNSSNEVTVLNKKGL